MSNFQPIVLSCSHNLRANDLKGERADLAMACSLVGIWSFFVGLHLLLIDAF